MHSQILLGSLHLSPGLVVFCGVARGVLATRPPLSLLPAYCSLLPRVPISVVPRARQGKASSTFPKWQVAFCEVLVLPGGVHSLQVPSLPLCTRERFLWAFPAARRAGQHLSLPGQWRVKAGEDRAVG